MSGKKNKKNDKLEEVPNDDSKDQKDERVQSMKSVKTKKSWRGLVDHKWKLMSAVVLVVAVVSATIYKI